MDVHWMNEAVVRADKAQLESFSDPHRNPVRCGIGPSIDREVVWLGTIHWHCWISKPFPHQPFLQEHIIFVVRFETWVWRGRVDNHRAI
jgi:surfactin synthase thioesterase subunit